MEVGKCVANRMKCWLLQESEDCELLIIEQIYDWIGLVKT